MPILEYLCDALTIINKILTGTVRIYQVAISPYLGTHCRHTPTCSQYTIDAINEWGPVKGIWLGMKRLSRCHPWGTHGYDPVPKNPKKAKGSKYAQANK